MRPNPNPNRHPSHRHFTLARQRTALYASASTGGTILHLQVGVILIGQGHSSRGVHLLLVLGEEGLVDLDLRGSEGEASDELERLVADEFPGKPEEGLLEVVVGLCRDVVVLEVLLSVEGDGLGLDLALLDVDLVTGEDDGDVLADADKIAWWQSVSMGAMEAGWGRKREHTVPVGDVLVGDTGGNVEHDDTALAVDVVTVTETTKLLLAGGVPHIELDLAEVLVFFVSMPAGATSEGRGVPW